jgi:glutamine amidotransferase
MLAIVDYGAGNVGSVANMLKRLSIPAVRATTPGMIQDADGVILPGVGAFDFCMSSFNASGMRDAVDKIVAEGQKPLLGICVGLQMMFRGSEEGQEKGLGWIAGDVIRFDKRRTNADLKIPHMGWNDVAPRASCKILNGIEKPRFYFVHSYHAQCDHEADISATATYGYEFCCAIAKGNLVGTQFHPEKSHRYGMAMLKNFSTIVAGNL